MASVNKVILVGNLGRDPEIRYAASGAAIANINIATSRRWKNNDTGQWEEQTEWHRVVMFNRLAEVAGEYLRTGSSVYIEGRLQTRKWQNKDGQDQYTTEVVAENMQMLGGRGEGGGGAQQGGGGSSYEGGYTPRNQGQAAGGAARGGAQQGGYEGGYQSGGAQQGGGRPTQQRQAPASGTSFDDMDDDIPF